MKIQRQSKINELIHKYDIETQEELGDMLKDAGFDVTQATISRDIRELKLIKVATENGKQKYAVSATQGPQLSEKFIRIYKEGVVNITYAQNIVVIKTLEAMAMPVAASIDAMNNSEIVGTIAGDNTVFCLTRSEESAIQIIDKLYQLTRTTETK